MNRILVSAWCLLVVLLAAVSALAQNDLSLATVVRVKDNDNNLRAWGGENYKQAPILHVVNQDEWLHVWNQADPGWLSVETPEGISGAVHAACLDPAREVGQTHDLDPALRQKLERFLKQLNMAAQSGNFGALELLLHPHGVSLNGKVLADAATVPAKQASVVMPLWYATDVSLTYGTAWELLVVGTDPQNVKVGWDSAMDTFRVFGNDMKPEDYVDQAHSEQGLLPMHEQALRLAPDAKFVDGWPDRVEGYPPADEPRGDYETTPFALVYATGPQAWRLEQADHIGFILYVEEYEGILRLRGAITQPW